MGSGRKIKLEVFKTENKGWGLRSPERIKCGTFVSLYLGEVLTNEEAERRNDDAMKMGLSYLFDLDAHIVIPADQDELSIGMDNDCDTYAVDGRDCGTVSRFINHSCSPNLRSVAVVSGRRDMKVYDLALFTQRTVQPWEELTFSYSHGTSPPTLDDTVKKWPCYCEAEGCRKWLFN